MEKLDDPFRIVRLMEMIMVRMLQNYSLSDRLFLIRNGKIWIDKKSPVSFEPGLWLYAREALRKKLVTIVANAKGDNKYIKFPEDLELVCPRSQKAFLGGLPYGSRFKLAEGKPFFLGIHWTEPEVDWDLSYITKSGMRIAWNGNVEAPGIIFSGDVVQPDPEASEVVLARQGIEDGIAFASAYNDIPTEPLDIFIGSDECRNFSHNYMVPEHSVRFRASVLPTKRTSTIGCVINGAFYVCRLDFTDTSTSPDSDLYGSMRDRCLGAVDLAPILLEAGYKPYTQAEANRSISPDIDLTNPTPDVILRLFQ